MQLEMEYFKKLVARASGYLGIFVILLRIWQAVFLALQLDGDVSWNWGLVLLPVWIYIFSQYVFAYCMRSWGLKKKDGIDEDSILSGADTDPVSAVHLAQSSELSSMATMGCLSQGIPVFVFVLLVSRLQLATFSTFIIILPVFIILGCCCCGVFCTICYLSCVSVDGMEENLQEGVKNNGHESYQNNEGPVPTNPPDNVIYGTFSASNNDVNSSNAVQAPFVKNADEKKSSDYNNTPPEAKASSEPLITNSVFVEID